jgi:hypothetical protein
MNMHSEYVRIWKDQASFQGTTLTFKGRDSSVAIAMG